MTTAKNMDIEDKENLHFIDSDMKRTKNTMRKHLETKE